MISIKPFAEDTHPLLKSKSPPRRLQNYQQKLQSALELNGKLKGLLQSMRNNALARKAELTQSSNENNSDDQHVARLRRREAKLTSQVQQLTNNLNVLVSENGKLKAQVDVSRNSRVIYSNVYKTIEKEIRKHEYLYKLAIVDHLAYEEVQKRTADRIAKTAKRIEKDIADLEGSSKPLRRKDKQKRKSRLDTGLSHRMQSKETCRVSEEERTTRQNPSLRETAPSRREPDTKRDPAQRLSSDKLEPVPTAPHERVLRSHGHILTEEVDEYYELEMRSNYYDNLMKHLREITGQQDLQRIAGEWKTVDSQVEAEYAEYLQLERQVKALREEREALERQYLRSEKEIGGESTEEERQLASVAAEVEAERRRVAELEERLTALIDINSARLTDEEIGQHVQRIRRRGDATARELQKLLENVGKENHSVGTSRVTHKSRVA